MSLKQFVDVIIVKPIDVLSFKEIRNPKPAKNNSILSYDLSKISFSL
jgi:hypothetical protein